MDLFKNTVITKADWIIIGLSVLLLLIVSLGFFVVAGVIDDRIETLNTQITQAQTKLSETRAIAARKEGLERELTEVREKIAAFEGRLPTEKEVPRLLDQFQQIAEESGVKYRLITAEPMDEKDLYVRIPFKVKVDGAYAEVGEFLRSLEFGDRFIKVEKLEIGPEKEGRSETNLMLSTYMFVTKNVLSQTGGAQS